MSPFHSRPKYYPRPFREWLAASSSFSSTGGLAPSQQLPLEVKEIVRAAVEEDVARRLGLRPDANAGELRVSLTLLHPAADQADYAGAVKVSVGKGVCVFVVVDSAVKIGKVGLVGHIHRRFQPLSPIRRSSPPRRAARSTAPRSGSAATGPTATTSAARRW